MQKRALAPARKVEMAQAMQAEHGVSGRQACGALGLSRSMLRNRRAVRDDSAVIEAVATYITARPRYGFGLLVDTFRDQRRPWGKTVLWRVYCQLNLDLLRAQPVGVAAEMSREGPFAPARRRLPDDLWRDHRPGQDRYRPA